MAGQEFRFTFPLKACPFCNKRAASLCENPSAHKYNRGWFISHGGKGCVLSGVQSRGYATPDQAADAWNRRADREGGRP